MDECLPHIHHWQVIGCCKLRVLFLKDASGDPAMVEPAGSGSCGIHHASHVLTPEWAHLRALILGHDPILAHVVLNALDFVVRHGDHGQGAAFAAFCTLLVGVVYVIARVCHVLNYGTVHLIPVWFPLVFCLSCFSFACSGCLPFRLPLFAICRLCVRAMPVSTRRFWNRSVGNRLHNPPQGKGQVAKWAN